MMTRPELVVRKKKKKKRENWVQKISKDRKTDKKMRMN